MLRRSDFIAATYALSLVFANFGIAIAARMPIMTTTIRSSIRVKPFLLLIASPEALIRGANAVHPPTIRRSNQRPGYKKNELRLARFALLSGCQLWGCGPNRSSGAKPGWNRLFEWDA